MEEEQSSDVVIIVGGTDQEACGAIATKIRGFLYGECIPTVAMNGLRNNAAYVDHEDVRNTWAHQGSDFVMDKIIEESDDMFSAMMKARPHLYDHLNVAIDVQVADVSIEAIRTERVSVKFPFAALESLQQD